MKRREFLKSLLGISMLPFLPCGFAIAKGSSWKDDIFAGITVDYIGSRTVLREVEWDEDLEPTKFDEYLVYRFHLSKNTEYLNDPDKVCCEAYAELDGTLIDGLPQDTKINFIIDELRIYAEAIQEATHQ